MNSRCFYVSPTKILPLFNQILLTGSSVLTIIVGNTPTKPLHECSNCVGFFMPATLDALAELIKLARA